MAGARPCNYYDDNDDVQREKKAKTGRQGDKYDRSCYYYGMSSCVCDYHHYSLKEEERQTTTGEMTAQREGSHYDTTTRMTAMTTLMQDGLQERFDKKIRTSLDYVIRLTDN